MAQPFIGEIRMFAGSFAPAGWAFCNGQIQSIAENETLFNLIGTTYGGDGQNTFALPDLRGRLPIHQGTGFVLGQLAGEEHHLLTTNLLPLHTHAVIALTNANSASPSNAVYGGNGSSAIFSAAPSAAMNSGMILANSGGQPHENRMPVLAVSYIISLFGIFPSQN